MAMWQFLKQRFVNDSFVRNSAVFFVGSGFVAFLNYLYQPIMGRLMTVEGFGEVQTIFSLLSQIGIVTGVFGMIIIHSVANKTGEGLNESLRELQALMILVVGGIAGALLVAHTWFQTFFSFASPLPLVALGAILIISIFTTLTHARLQGARLFGKLSVTGALVAGSKLAFAALFVLVGFETVGAIGALLIATIIGLIYSQKQLRQPLLYLPLRLTRPSPELRKDLLFGVLAFFATGTMTVLYTADMLVVKALFTPEEAGLYGGITTIARILVFLGGPISGVLLSSVVLSQTLQENALLLKKGLLLVGAIAGAGLGMFVFFPTLITTLLLGQRYAAFADLLPRLGILMFMVALANVFFLFFLALRQYVVIPVAIAGLSITSIALFLSHGTIPSVINGFTYGAVTSLILSIGAFFYIYHHSLHATPQRVI